MGQPASETGIPEARGSGPAYFFFFMGKLGSRVFYILRKRKRETRWAQAYLEGIEQEFGGILAPHARRRIAIGHGIFIPMMYDAFAALHGRTTTPGERERNIHYFICSTLFDDFTDERRLPLEQLRSMAFDPDSYTGESFEERVFLNSNRILRDFVKDPEGYHQVSREFFAAQADSVRQLESGLSPGQIQDITFRKCGNAIRLCRFYMDYIPYKGEDACWFDIGVIIQLTDDLLDLYEDLQAGIQTLPARMKDIGEFEALFLGQVRDMKQAIRNLPVPWRLRQEFSLNMAGIYSFALIALGQLRSLQGNRKALPELSSLPRKALIVNMENPLNLLRWIRYTFRNATLGSGA